MTKEEREQARKTIEVIEKRYATLDEEERKALYLAIEALKQEPIGHWIIDIDESRRWDRKRFYCSECGDWQTYGETKFCPECGCAMERSEDR